MSDVPAAVQSAYRRIDDIDFEVVQRGSPSKSVAFTQSLDFVIEDPTRSAARTA
ncbi:hypothetical protein [Agromyces sp. Marseille-P2726]|uniref:hypothetical protein n=1 Tax=Agromyces sp. Marseille-P2726 TaxID=2709132 RepID=UPI0015715C69|nr:hypothetical protein [Agromyces sp. Marseille-P2726]